RCQSIRGAYFPINRAQTSILLQHAALRRGWSFPQLMWRSRLRHDDMVPSPLRPQPSEGYEHEIPFWIPGKREYTRPHFIVNDNLSAKAPTRLQAAGGLSRCVHANRSLTTEFSVIRKFEGTLSMLHYTERHK